MFQFDIPLAPLWIWKHAVFTLPCRLKSSLNLSFDQQKVSSKLLEKINTKVFWSENFGLLGIKSVHGRPNSPSEYTDC